MATRTDVEVVLVKRAGALMAKAGMAVTVVGSNADLDDPVAYALRQVGCADVDGVASDDYDEFLDYAEYRLLENVLGNLTGVDTKLGPRSEMLSQLSRQVEAKMKRIENKLGLSAGGITTGVIVHEFASHD